MHVLLVVQLRHILFYSIILIRFSLTHRFIEKEPIHKPELLLIVGILGLLVNLVGLCLLYGAY